MLRIEAIIWLEGVVDKLLKKHNVRMSEVIDVFKSNPHFRFVERGYKAGEDVYAALGQTTSGCYIIVFFVYKKDGSVLIVSARDMTKTERNKYEKG